MAQQANPHKPIRCMQINTGRKKDSHDLVHASATKQGIDIVLVSEPNKSLIRKHGWPSDNKEDAALIILNQDLTAQHLGKGDGFVWVEIEDWVIYSCYISPNIEIAAFRTFIDNLQMDTKRHNKGVVIVGDFNSKSYMWTSKKEDSRGREMADWINQDQLVVHNEDYQPTFVRYNQESVIDLTLMSPQAAKNITNWRVSEEEALSWHRAIYFHILTTKPTRYKEPVRQRPVGWKINKEREPDFEKELDKIANKRLRTGKKINAEELTAMVTEACNAVFPKKKIYSGTKRGVYWWNQQIGQTRKDCIVARRVFVRASKNGTEEEKTTKKLQYKEQRTRFKKLIQNAKKDAWSKLLQDLDQDIWGKAYQITTGKLKQRKHLDDQKQLEEAKLLFPEVGPTHWPKLTVTEEIPLFTEEELSAAVDKLKNKKAAGPDAIPPEIAKSVAKNQGELFLGIANRAITESKFPDIWKVANLVLLEKPKKRMEDRTTYRPLCLLNTMGKILEDMVGRRINNELEQNGGLNDRQFGFRKGRSTIQAIQEVQRIVDTTIKKRNNRGFCILVTIDVKNAFNSVRWQGIAEAMRTKNISNYLVKLTESYLKGRSILVGSVTRHMTCGVPQGSKLGPILWNINYDGVLEMELPQGATLIGFADDLALVVTGWTAEELQLKTECALERVVTWLGNKGLEIAPQKTEAVLLAGRNTIPTMDIKVQGQIITTKKAVKYLGVYLDKDMRMREHVRITTEKAEAVAGRLSRIMPNIDGPRASKRLIVNSVVNSILLYAAPTWARAMNVQRYVDMLVRVQRRMALRICSSYRTASTPAIQVVAGTIPVNLLVEERTKVYEQGEESKKRIRQETIDEWQRARNQLQHKAEWTKRLIPDVGRWTARRHGEVNFHLTQLLTGHGCFQAYLARFNRSQNDRCVYCDKRDTAEHTFFQCPRWCRRKIWLDINLEVEVSPDNIIRLMLESEQKWSLIATYVKDLLTSKEEGERQRQKMAP